MKTYEVVIVIAKYKNLVPWKFFPDHDINSISESESESCGKVLLCVSEGFGFWSARLTTKAWVDIYIYTLIPPQHQGNCC